MADTALDPRAQRSLLALNSAVTDLLDAMPLSALAVTGIVEKAGVSRPTFYQHYESIAAAAQYAALARLSDALPWQPKGRVDELSAEETTALIVARAIPIFEHLHAHHQFYLRVMEGAGTLDFFERLTAFVAARTLDEPEGASMAAKDALAQKDATLFVASGVLWMVLRWLKSDFSGPDSPQNVAQRLAATLLAH